MGLDMYLRKRPNFSNDENVSGAICSFVTWIRSKMEFGFGYECSYEDWCGHDYNDLPDTKSLVETLEKYPLDSFDEEIGYWRKANAIHKWFVENVQDGIDDCCNHQVTKDDLLRLKDLCEKVLENHDLADKLLPSFAGFFFGDLEYNDMYFDKLQYTAELCARLTEEDGFDFENYYLYYVTSW